MIRWVSVLLASAVAAGCADEAGSAAGKAETAEAAAVAADAGLLPGTPAGGLETWIRDVREGLTQLPDQAGRDPAAAQKHALGLYVTRQEYIEMYYGPAGRLTRGEVLGREVAAAEARFHDLMQLLQTGTPERKAVVDAVTALDAQYSKVLDAARAAQVVLSPHAAGSATR